MPPGALRGLRGKGAIGLLVRAGAGYLLASSTLEPCLSTSDHYPTPGGLKTCPECGRVFDAAAADFICPDDGTPLVTFSRDDALVGQVIAGRFEVEEMLGAGGMGAVYRARQLSVDRLVAIKVLKRDILDDQQAVRRFFLEAKATSRLTNPHTVTVHDFGQTEDGLLFIAMEYLDGRDLRDRLRVSGHIPASEAVAIIDSVAESLSEAHLLEIIHRDLKPENIFLVRRGDNSAFVKVLDFGIARAQTLTGDKGLTATGSIAGTPAYMSPEMVKGEGVGPEADVYAMGILLYEMISGRQPIDGTTPFMVMQRHLTQMPEPLHEVLDLSVVPKLLSLFIQRCLDKDPTKRPADARAFRSELARSYEGPQTQPTLPSIGEAGPVSSGVALLQTQRATSEQIRSLTDEGLQGTAAKHQAIDTEHQRLALAGLHPGRGKRIALAAAAILCLGLGATFALSGDSTVPKATPTSSATEAKASTAEDAKLNTTEVAADRAAPEPATRPAAVAPPVAPVPAQAKVSISVMTTPTGAEIRLDGKLLGKTPTLLKLPRGEDTVTLTLSLDGHTPLDLKVVPTEDRLMTTDLTPIAKAAPPKPRARARRHTPRPKPAAKPKATKPAPKPKHDRYDDLFGD